MTNVHNSDSYTNMEQELGIFYENDKFIKSRSQ
jgi:hypothetical protein